MQEGMQSAWVILLLGMTAACADSTIIVSIDDDSSNIKNMNSVPVKESNDPIKPSRRDLKGSIDGGEFKYDNSPLNPDDSCLDKDGDINSHVGWETFKKVCMGYTFDAYASSLYEEPSEGHESDIVIANHQTLLDWIYIWAFMLPLGREGSLKIILKKSVGSIPVYGLAVKLVNFILLARRWEQDRRRLEDRLNNLPCEGIPFSLLLFPEGTTIVDRGRASTKRFAIKTGLPVPRFTLIPRVTGTQFALTTLAPHIDGVFDLTIAYSGIGGFGPQRDQMLTPEDRYSPLRVYFLGDGPREVHIHVRYIPLPKIPYQFSNCEDLGSRSINFTSTSSEFAPLRSTIDPKFNIAAMDGTDSIPPEKINNPYVNLKKQEFENSVAVKAPDAGTLSINFSDMTPENSNEIGNEFLSESQSDTNTRDKLHSTSPPSTKKYLSDSFRTTKEFEEWMYGLFQEKELLLGEFYKNGHFPGTKCVRPSLAPNGACFGVVLSGIISITFFYIIFYLIYLGIRALISAFS